MMFFHVGGGRGNVCATLRAESEPNGEGPWDRETGCGTHLFEETTNHEGVRHFGGFCEHEYVRVGLIEDFHSNEHECKTC